ncbi:MAG: phosphoribosylglycinamide formyltransferase [Prevotellaceae bacterium]|jgi:phosphoribosylglycinamide formyltransferase-1|nr:phosphoribosylglycinamide formyltransferase [Prevotellaceae bacterium]
MLNFKKIAIFASGAGSNAENIIKYFENSDIGKVKIVFCNVPNAYVVTRASGLGVPVMIFSRDEFYNSNKIINNLLAEETDLIVLAGFLWLIPKNIIQLFDNKIINIHPALLPSYGGKGMFGENVHKAVIADGKKESGITIHYVNEKYDDGNIIFQAKCEITSADTPATLAQKVHALEYEFFPKIIESVLINLSC